MGCDRGGACGAVQGRWLRVEGTELRPAPSPPPRSATLPALAARALQGTRASGAQAVPSRPGGRGAQQPTAHHSPLSQGARRRRGGGT
ncbi:hypothetical protein XocBAI20_05870 [Xanthomonas oryzae pv. oryzicola]|nr:hypothetical protein XocBAI20_05870 [Xanthomonas oryzae pv. oryzicola]